MPKLDFYIIKILYVNTKHTSQSSVHNMIFCNSTDFLLKKTILPFKRRIVDKKKNWSTWEDKTGARWRNILPLNLCCRLSTFAVNKYFLSITYNARNAEMFHPSLYRDKADEKVINRSNCGEENKNPS